MTNQFTDEQVEAAAKALWDPRNTGFDPQWEGIEPDVQQAFRRDARAALEAAALVAPVQPSSTVGVGKIADEMERHRHVMVAPGPHQCSCSFVMSEDPGFSGWAREHKLHVARAVVEAIGGESR